MSSKPRIAITLGDPAGIGSEIFAKAYPEITARCTPVVYGAGWSLQDGFRLAGVRAPTDLDLHDVGMPKQNTFRFGEVAASCGDVSLRSIDLAAAAALAGEVDAMMTCPINKEAIHAAGSQDIGHQEILARKSEVTAMATMLMTPGLRVVHLSTHKSLADAVRFVTHENVLEKLRLCDASFARWGLSNPRIAVAALNPHGGEGGLLGREEIEELTPAVADACAEGINVAGPIPADSVFTRAIGGEFDLVLALYHDQGHVAIKVHDFHQSISATLGLPFVRTSVDHGTAFDIAGKGQANEASTVAAIDAAITLSAGVLGQ